MRLHGSLSRALLVAAVCRVVRAGFDVRANMNDKVIQLLEKRVIALWQATA